MRKKDRSHLLISSYFVCVVVFCLCVHPCVISEPLCLFLFPVQHFTDLLDDMSQEVLLGQLLSDPFLSGRSDMMDMDEELSPASPPPPHIQAEHSYSLCGDSRPQSPLSHLTTEKTSSEPSEWGEIPLIQHSE